MLSLLQGAALLSGLISEIEQETAQSVKEAGDKCAEKARSVVGTYEYGWPPLNAETVARKGADTPLLETGAFRDSIKATMIGARECEVSSDDPKAGWFEDGTTKMPPRPVFEPTATIMEPEIAATIKKGLDRVKF